MVRLFNHKFSRIINTEIREGQGIYINYDGGIYEGWRKSGKLHGKGRVINPNGVIYEGDYLDGFANGQGNYTFSDGRIYRGKWNRF